MLLSLKQAFIAMIYVLEEFFEKEKTDDLGALLGILSLDTFVGDMPADIACWYDWEQCVKNIQRNSADSLEITEIEGYNAMVEFLGLYCREFGYNLNSIVGKLEENKTEQISFWKECVRKATSNQ